MRAQLASQDLELERLRSQVVDLEAQVEALAEAGGELLEGMEE